MPVMGFDDERVRDGYWAEVDGRRAAGDWQAALRAALVEIDRREAEAEEFAAWLERVGQAMERFAAAVVEAFRPLIEAISAIGEAVFRAIEEVWELLVGDEQQGRYRGPAHYNCRCLPVERVDPVKAGRTRWWARK